MKGTPSSAPTGNVAGSRQPLTPKKLVVTHVLASSKVICPFALALASQVMSSAVS
jgi:hypothetical protein